LPSCPSVQVANGHAIEGAVVGVARAAGLREFRVVGQVPDGHFEVLVDAVAQDFHGHPGAGLGFANGEFKVPAVADFFAVVFDDHVAVLQARLVSRASGNDVVDERAAGVRELERFGQRRGDILNHDAQVAAADMAVFDQAIHDVAGEIRGDGKTNALVAAGAAVDGGVDADEPALHVHQRAAGIARVDGRIGLDEVLVFFDAEVAPARGADNAGGDGLAHAEGIADGQHKVAHLDFIAVGHWHKRQVLRLHFDDGDIRLRVPPDYFGRQLPAVLQRDFHLVGAVHHVVIGENIAIFGDNHTGAQPELARDTELPAGRRVGRRVAKAIAKEPAPERIVEAEPAGRGVLGGFRRYDNFNHRRGDLFDDGRETDVGPGGARHGGFVHFQPGSGRGGLGRGGDSPRDQGCGAQRQGQ